MLIAPRHRPRRLREPRLPPARLDRREHRRGPRARREDARGRAASATSSGSPARCSAASSRACTRGCSRSPTTIRTPAARSSSAPRPPRRWPSCWRSCSPSTARSAPSPRSIDGVYTGREGGPFNYREGKAQAIRELAEREGIDLAGLLRLLATPSPTCRCCGSSGILWRSIPDKELARVAREEGWEIMRFERLGRKLRVAAAAALLSGGSRCAGWCAHESPRADRGPAGDPRAGEALRRREDRAARGASGTANTTSRASSSTSSASSG